MSILTVQHLEKHFENTKVLNDISFSLEEGQALSIIGSSGSGKTTLLRCLNFLETPDAGTITVQDKVLFDADHHANCSEKEIRKNRLHFGMVFQSFNLFPQYTALENVTLARELMAKDSGESKEAIRAAGMELLDQMGLADRAGHYPHQLSGGQQQRVALARILCSQPEVILLDEPFSALDSYLKWDLELKLSDFLENFSGPILWVSHDRGEVFRNCKRVCILDQGASQGTFTLRQLFHEPETEAAARLSGCKNIVEAVPAGSAVTLPAWGLTLNCGKPVPADVRQAGIRARHVMTVPEGTPDAFYCTVERVIQDVFTTIVLLRPEGAADGAPLLRMELERDDWRRLNRPEGLWIAVQPRDVLLLK